MVSCPDTSSIKLLSRQPIAFHRKHGLSRLEPLLHLIRIVRPLASQKKYDNRECTRAFWRMGLLSYFQNSIIRYSILEGLIKGIYDEEL